MSTTDTSRVGKPPRLTVMMPVYNAERYVAAAIEGVLGQTFRDFELLILDDGSQDGSFDIVRHYAKSDSRVKCTSRPNRGVGATRNELLSLARGEYLAVNDADDVSLPDRFERQVVFLDAHPDCVVVGGRMLFVDPEGVEVGEFFRLLSHDEIDASHLRGETAIGASTVMTRAAAVRQVGGYRPEFSPAEDYDLYLRLGEIGRLANRPEILARYRLHSGSLSHLQCQRASQRQRAALREACQRRGRKPASAPLLSLPQRWLGNAHFRSSLLAMSVGNHRLARAYARKCLGTAPGSAGSWLLLVLTWLGPLGNSLVRAARSCRRPR